MPRKIPLPYDAEAAKQYRIKNKERMNQLDRQRYQKNKERILASQRRRYQLDRPNRLAYAKKYREEFREEVLEYKRKWSRLHPERNRYRGNMGVVWRADPNIPIESVPRCSERGCIWPADGAFQDGYCAYHRSSGEFELSLFDQAKDFTFFRDLRTISVREFIQSESVTP